MPSSRSAPAARPGPRKIAALIAIGALVLGASVVLALAKERITMLRGVGVCKAWCDANRVGAELAKCRQNCENYWMCNGSDSTAQTCADAPPKVREAAPQPPPGRNVGPAFIPHRPKVKSN